MEKVVEVREAVREDCREVHRLIQELADFEEMPDGPKIDHQILEKDGFNCENPLFKCYVAICDAKIVGYAVYFYIYSTLERRSIHLEDLYVTPDYRLKKIGSRLFDTVAKKTFDAKCQYLDFSVLSWNPAQKFYKSKGSMDLTEMEGWHMYRLDEEALEKLATNYVKDIYDVREARLDDLNSIKRLAQDASSYQKMKFESKFDDISIIMEESTMNVKSPYYGYLVVVLDEKVVGYALYCFTYSTWEGKSMYLQEFYVSSNDHKANMKKDLFSAVAKKACEEKCCRVDFWVLDPEKEGQFFASNGAENLTESEEWHLYRLFELVKKPL